MERVILIVEDDLKSLKLFRDLLQATGYATLEATNGKKAVELAKEKKPDLILMDIQMPTMDGFEATKAIRNWECGLRKKIEEGPYSESEIRNLKSQIKKIPIIALTASVMQGSEARIREAGCDGYISKPIDTRGFLKTVSELLHYPTGVLNGN